MIGTLLQLCGLGLLGAYDNHHNSRAQVFKRQRAKEQQDHADFARRKAAEGIFINLSTGIDQNGTKWWGESRWSVERELSGR